MRNHMQFVVIGGVVHDDVVVLLDLPVHHALLWVPIY